jgi:tetratricopeptide (TPR) repeat protein
VILPAFAAPVEAELHHGQDMLGLARWLQRGRTNVSANDDANALYRRAIDAGLPDDNLFRALWETALIEKKRGRRDEMIRICRDLADVRNDYRVTALAELAKHYEHHEKDIEQAIAFTIQALEHEPTDELEHRRDRLQRKLAKQAGSHDLLQTTMTIGS